MTEAEIRTGLNDYTALSLTLWAEARGEPIEGLVGVGWVIKNRLAHFPRYRATDHSYKGVVFAPSQFSCWNPGADVNHRRLLAMATRIIEGENLTDPAWVECAWVAVGIIENRLRDRTRAACTHYLTADLYHNNPPLWAKRLRFVTQLGSHVFLVEPAEPSLTQRA